MRIQIRKHTNAAQIGFATLVFLLLNIFCYAVGFSLVIPLLLLLLGVYLFYFRKANAKLFLNLSLLLVLIIFTTHTFDEYTDLSKFYIPVSGVAMLTILLYNDLQLAFIMSFLSSVFVSLILGGDFYVMLIFFIGSLTGVYAVNDARNRGQLINAGLFVGLMQVIAVVMLFSTVHFIFTKDFLLNYLRPLIINGFIAAFVVMATLRIFEQLFGVVTNFSLLELSDFNQPLLKRMILEAPGTYQHSLIVSNLSEAAADAIGANALLTRVGAYYHDIGKMEKPEYFTENQLIGGNKHDNLEPSMSRLVILNHVKEGIELAKRYKLSPQIIDFIPQHHGTSLVYYFYQKALEEADDKEKVSEENFRYPGPKPQTRETAIVMLADSAEGATRAVDEPTPGKIEEVVRRVINNKFIDGQLDECNLTLKEIDRIAVTFTRVLSAMYHGRIKYPEKKNGKENQSRKSSEKSLPKPPPNNRPNKKDSPS